jgi:DNA-directed RNA polymerase specialized sigma24 family protein
VSALASRWPELESWARSRAVTQLSHWSLRDFDFDARVTLASSALANVREPTLLLSLLLAQPQSQAASDAGLSPATRKLALELGREDLDKLLEQMSKINQIVQQYTIVNDAVDA